MKLTTYPAILGNYAYHTSEDTFVRSGKRVTRTYKKHNFTDFIISNDYVDGEPNAIKLSRKPPIEEVTYQNTVWEFTTLTAAVNYAAALIYAILTHLSRRQDWIGGKIEGKGVIAPLALILDVFFEYVTDIDSLNNFDPYEGRSRLQALDPMDACSLAASLGNKYEEDLKLFGANLRENSNLTLEQGRITNKKFL